MGAVGVQLGTRFVCANESIAHANFKRAFIRASARDAIPSVQIDQRLPVIPVRALKNREMENFAAKQREVAQQLDDGAIEMAEAQLQIEHYWAGALRRAVIDGDVETGSVMAGQSVGMVTRRPPHWRAAAKDRARPRTLWKPDTGDRKMGAGSAGCLRRLATSGPADPTPKKPRALKPNGFLTEGRAFAPEVK
jgi:NAD(P)H-dependent flavin oxidoreductase YrpB (nitropropane dioxygenase family)